MVRLARCCPSFMITSRLLINLALGQDVASDQVPDQDQDQVPALELELDPELDPGPVQERGLELGLDPELARDQERAQERERAQEQERDLVRLLQLGIHQSITVWVNWSATKEVSINVPSLTKHKLPGLLSQQCPCGSWFLRPKSFNIGHIDGARIYY